MTGTQRSSQENLEARWEWIFEVVHGPRNINIHFHQNNSSWDYMDVYKPTRSSSLSDFALILTW
jgi:hypothetical protein